MDALEHAMQQAASLYQAGQWLAAERACREMLGHAPAQAQVHALLASVLIAQGRLLDASGCYQSVLALNPSHFDAHNNLGTIYKNTGRLADAETHYRRALQLAPHHAAALCNLGSVLADQGRYEEGLELCRRACQLAPTLAAAFYNAGYILLRFGRADEAIAAVRRAVELEPTSAVMHSTLLYDLNFSASVDDATHWQEHREWGRRHADGLTSHAAPHGRPKLSSRPLRIGYVSPNFHNHAVAFFVEPILAAHDREAFEIVCYSDARQHDDVTQRMQATAEWRDVVGRTDEEVADLIRQDRIDILVDLAGHLGGSRLLAFARKPAPIQVTYLGYQATTGMRAMDYRLTDAWSDPPGETEHHHTETLFRLPETFFCYQPSPNVPLSMSPPLVSNGNVTFGSFNNFAKISPTVLTTWATILRELPGSGLVVIAPTTESVQASVRSAFGELGVSADRVQLVDRCPREEYLQWINRVDIALDSFPFMGHTTTCDTLWMGVPVVALVGRNYGTRFGASALVNLGLEDLIATTQEQYVQIAQRLAHDPERLQQLRRDLRGKMQSSILCDAERFTRNLETAYRTMWKHWCEQGD